MNEELRARIAEIEGDLISWRRDFHRNPEVAFNEVGTSRVIKEILEGLGLPVKNLAGTGLRADLKGGQAGPTVALRADIDALPLQEQGDKDYLSLNPGAAHCCAHDGHMAVVLGAAKVLTGMRDSLPGNVVFLFQPAEELPPGGAVTMVEEGALKGVDAIFGLHFWQPLPTGKVGAVKGPMMAAADNFRITVRGRAGHGSMPHQTVDSILTAAQLVVSLQSIISRNLDPLKPGVVSLGTIQGGTVYNIIPEEVILTGTVRSFDAAVQDLARTRLQEITQKTCEAFGAEGVMEYEPGYPPVVNPPEMVDFVLGVVEKELGRDRIVEIDPVMGGEDFAYYLHRIPGAFLFFGMGDGQAYPHHHPRFDMDEKALPQAALLLTALAVEYLEKAGQI
jgi:amidohydrolase